MIVTLAVTRDGMPVRSWVLPGDTADVATVARVSRTAGVGPILLKNSVGLIFTG